MTRKSGSVNASFVKRSAIRTVELEGGEERWALDETFGASGVKEKKEKSGLAN